MNASQYANMKRQYSTDLINGSLKTHPVNQYLNEICSKIEQCPKLQLHLRNLINNNGELPCLYDNTLLINYLRGYVTNLNSNGYNDYNLWIGLFPNVKNKVIIYRNINNGPFIGWSLVINCVHNYAFYDDGEYVSRGYYPSSHIQILLIETNRIGKYSFERNYKHNDVRCTIM